MRLEPRIPGLRVKHLTTEPRGTLPPFQSFQNAISFFPGSCEKGLKRQIKTLDIFDLEKIKSLMNSL